MLSPPSVADFTLFMRVSVACYLLLSLLFMMLQGQTAAPQEGVSADSESPQFLGSWRVAFEPYWATYLRTPAGRQRDEKRLSLDKVALSHLPHATSLRRFLFSKITLRACLCQFCFLVLYSFL